MVTGPTLGILNDICDISVYTLILTKFKQFNQFLACNIHEFIWPLSNPWPSVPPVRGGSYLILYIVRSSIQPIPGNFLCKFNESVYGSELNRHAALEVLENRPTTIL